MDVRFLFKFIEPRSKNEDLRRREFILNILLLGALILSAAITIRAQIDLITRGTAYKGISPEIPLIIFLTFLALYFFSRAGFFIPVAYAFIGICFVSTTYTVYNWGVDVPQGLLTYALIIIMSGVLIGTRFASVTTLTISLILILFTYLQAKSIITLDSYWKSTKVEMNDTVTVVFTFGVMMLVCYLYNREIKRALYRVRRSETALKKERDLLEIKVEKRTRQLRQAQLEKMFQLYRFAEFGRLASGLFHDLVNPLTDISLNLERLNIKETSSFLKRAVSGTKRMENFVKVARKQIQKQETKINFSLLDEIDQAIQILSHRAKEKRVEIHFQCPNNLEIYGNPLRFHQLVTNLLSNGIDAYEKTKQSKRKRQVLVELKEADSIVRLSVQDWGCGIPPKHLGKLFDPFFTTKSIEKGTGLGLCICKDIVEKDFKGSINVQSKQGKNKGTTFLVEFPIKQGDH